MLGDDIVGSSVTINWSKRISTLAYCNALPVVEMVGQYLKIPLTNHLCECDSNLVERLFHVCYIALCLINREKYITP